MKKKVLLLIVILLSVGFIFTACEPYTEPTTTTWITYIQYEVLGKQIFYDGGFLGTGSKYKMDVRVNGDKVERWKLDNDKELYYAYEVGDFFYEKRIHKHGSDIKELLPGKIQQ